MYSKRCFELKLDVLDIFLQLIAIEPTELYDNRKSENNQKKDATEADLDNDQNIDVIGEGQALTEKWVTDQNLFQPLIIRRWKKIMTWNSNKYMKMQQAFSFKGQQRKKRMKDFLAHYHVYQAMSKEDTRCVINPWELCLDDRWKLYKFWLEEFSRVDFMEALMEI